MDPGTVKAIQLKQMSRMFLARQGQLVESMLEEGLMTNDDAEEVCDGPLCETILESMR